MGGKNLLMDFSVASNQHIIKSCQIPLDALSALELFSRNIFLFPYLTLRNSYISNSVFGFAQTSLFFSRFTNRNEVEFSEAKYLFPLFSLAFPKKRIRRLADLFFGTHFTNLFSRLSLPKNSKSHTISVRYSMSRLLPKNSNFQFRYFSGLSMPEIS